MIGWYVHHQGSGHLHRARAVRHALRSPVTVLSSLPRPADWDGGWVELASDETDTPHQPDAGGRLHWAPLHHPGLATRMAQISQWIGAERPTAMVCDVSVEVSLLARLHGIPVVVVAMPGDRDDEPHRLAYDTATAVIGCWPPGAERLFRSNARLRDRLHLVGGVSRFPVAECTGRRPGPPRVSVLLGTGGTDITSEMIDRARAETPAWEWTIMGRHVHRWNADPFETLCDSDVVVTQAGQNAIAEVASARRPAVVIPADRPHGEQRATATALDRGGWPVTVRASWPASGWHDLLRTTAALDGPAWARWCDGLAAQRFARIVETVGPHPAAPVP